MLPSKHQNNLGVAVGAERDHCYFFHSQGGRSPLFIYHIIFRNLTKGQGLTYGWANDPCTFHEQLFSVSAMS